MARSGLRSRLGCCAALLLAVATATTGAPATTAAEGVTTTVLAERSEEALGPVRHWVLRDEHPLEGDAHGHASGFLYQVAGESVLAFEDGTGVTLRAGEATWMPWGVGHLHRRPMGMRGGNDDAVRDGAGTGVDAAWRGGAGLDARAMPRVWTFLLETEPEARRPGARWISPALRGLGDGAYTARLTRDEFGVGAAFPPQRHAGPELLYFQTGRWEVRDPAGRAALEGERVVLVDPRIPYALRNVGDGPAGLLRLSLVPAGRPPAEELPPDVLDE